MESVRTKWKYTWVEFSYSWKAFREEESWMKKYVHACKQTGIVTSIRSLQFSSVAQLCLTLWPHGPQPAKPPCPSLTSRAYSNSCSSSWWCHPTISSSVNSFSSCLQSFPASGSFPMSQFFVSGAQSIRASAPASVLPMNIKGWFPLELTGLISLLSKELSGIFPAPQFKSINSLAVSPLYGLTSIHDYWKNHSFDYMGLSCESDVYFLICCLGLF